MAQLKLVWLRTAVRQLDEQAAYIAEENPVAARRIVAAIERAVGRLSEHPESGRPGRVPGTRELPVPGTPFILPYRVERSRVVILRVLHGARRWPPHF